MNVHLVLRLYVVLLFDIDREYTAEKLGFECPTRNSLDSVSDRDFALEFLSCISILAVHLSRFADECVIWTSQPYNYVVLPEQYTTGSSDSCRGFIIDVLSYSYVLKHLYMHYYGLVKFCMFYLNFRFACARMVSPEGILN